MTTPFRCWLLFALTLLVLAPSGRLAFAQPIDITANVDVSEIELGETVTYTLQANSPTKEAPSDPKLSVPGGFTLVDSGSSPSHMVSIVNGRATERHGLTTQWALRADRLGTFSIGPGSILLGGIRRSGPAQRVTVVAPGAGRAKPKRPRPQPFDPFGGSSPLDPFKGLFPGMDDERSSDPFSGISADPKLAIDAPRAPTAFLHATVDKTRAVVGEQVTLTVYLYEDLHARQGRPTDVHEATATDFVKRSLLQDETRATHVGNAIVGGKPWAVKLVRKNALFPIKTGKLAIAPMSLTLAQVKNGVRESETLSVEVTEPSAAGRPPGYVVGDTGDFSLSASVAPRNVEQHGAIGVTVELRGTGNMPASLATPEVGGVEWLEPQTKDSLGPASAEKFGGTRTFSYVVRLHKDGAIDLGELRLPYFDPQTRAYNVARAALGIVQVASGTGRDAGTEVAEQPLPGLPKPRAALEGKREESYFTERPAYWGALFGSPLASVLAIVVSGAVRRARKRRAEAAPSPERVARTKRESAEAAMKGDDGKVAAAAAARAVEAEVVVLTGVNIRGTAADVALRELVDAGVAPSSAKDVLEVLSACEDARFSPSDVPIEDARSLWARGKTALAAITSEPPRSKDSA